MTKRLKQAWTWEKLESELRLFIEVQHLDDAMPFESELRAAGRGDLLSAIRRHGGVRAVAARLELDTAPRRPAGYWDEFQNLERALRAFLAEHACAGTLPSSRQLRAAGRSDLVAAIAHHGGFSAVAERLGLEPVRPPRHAPGYWDEFENLTRELHTFAAAHDHPGIMPSTYSLRTAERTDLAQAITQHGGPEAVAARAGLERRDRRQRRHWANPDILSQALHACASTLGHPGVMPTYGELVNARRADLLGAIRLHGGFVEVANDFGLQRPER